MKILCGTDIIEINRIKEAIENLGEKFINKVYTKKEIEYCESKNKQKYQHYAGRFAAKEATFKAISEEIKNKYNISWKDIEIINNEKLKPIVKLNSKEEIKKIENIDISISHCKEYAIATTVVII